MANVEWISIEEVLTWGSIDDWRVYCRERNAPIPALIRLCANDRQYIDVETSIRTRGFRVPLKYGVVNGKCVHGDGQHRLTAAYNLGYKMIPYRKVKNPKNNIAKDSHGFSIEQIAKYKGRKELVHPDNPAPSSRRTARSHQTCVV